MSRLERPQGNSYGMNVSKSFIPSRGYVSASQAGKQSLRQARSAKYGGVHSGRGDIARRGPRAKDSELNQNLALMETRNPVVVPSGKKNVYWDAGSEMKDRDEVARHLPKRVRRPVVINPSASLAASGGLSGFTTARLGPRAPATVNLTSLGRNRETVAHELAHATPRRNYHRLNMNPGQLGREEGRADVAGIRASGKNRTGSVYESKAVLGRKRKNQVGNLAALNNKFDAGEYSAMRSRLGHPVPGKMEVLRGIPKDVRNAVRGVRNDSLPFSFGLGNRYNDLRAQEKAQRAARIKKVDDLVERYGLKGPLPKNLSREERMAAYEARYNAAGGPKGEVWDRRARAAAGVTAAGAGVTGVGAIGALASRGPGKVRRASNAAMLGGTAAWGLGSAAGYDARRRRASYRSSPAGVAGSALTRMRNYTPGE